MKERIVYCTLCGKRLEKEYEEPVKRGFDRYTGRELPPLRFAARYKCPSFSSQDINNPYWCHDMMAVEGDFSGNEEVRFFPKDRVQAPVSQD